MAIKFALQPAQTIAHKDGTYTASAVQDREKFKTPGLLRKFITETLCSKKVPEIESVEVLEEKEDTSGVFHPIQEVVVRFRPVLRDPPEA